MSIKKFLKMTTFTMIGTVMMVTSAIAGNGDVGATQVELGVEKQTVSNPVYADNVSYTLGTPYVNNDVVTFTLSDGTFEDTNYFLAVDNGTGYTTAPCGSTPFALISGGNGSDTLTFRVTDDTAIKGGNCTTGNSALEAGTIYHLVNVAADNATIAANEYPLVDAPYLPAGDTLDVTVASKTSANLSLDTSGTKTTALFNYNNQFSASLITQADVTIDVEAERKLFTGAANSDQIVIQVVSAGPMVGGNRVTLAGNDAITVTLSGDMAGILSINDGTDNMTIDTANSTASITYDVAQITALNGSAFGDAIETMTLTYTLTVDETTALDTRTFTASSDLDFEDEIDKNLIATGSAAGEWNMNGMQAKVPYIALNASGYLSFLKAVNESSQSVGVSIDAVIADYTDIANPVFTEQTVSLSDLAANSVTTISESDIVTALGLDSATLYHVALTITVNGPQNEIQITGFQKDAVGRTVLQVLYNTGNANDSRTWQ